MHESEFDHKWENESDPDDRYEELEARYAQLKAQHEELLAGVTELAPVVSETKPSEYQLAIISLLMRLYDINMALLSHFDEDSANEIYETHEKGGHFNPQIFIPNFGDDNESN